MRKRRNRKEDWEKKLREVERRIERTLYRKLLELSLYAGPSEERKEE